MYNYRVRDFTIKNLMETFQLGRNDSKLIRAILNEGVMKNLDKLPKTDKWIDTLYNTPKPKDIVLEAFNEILQGSGIETVTNDGESVEIYGQNIVIEYINLGDSYKPTICFDWKKCKFLIACMADYAERY